MSWEIVKFTGGEGNGIVSENWLGSDSKVCYWPPYGSADVVQKAIRPLSIKKVFRDRCTTTLFGLWQLQVIFESIILIYTSNIIVSIL